MELLTSVLRDGAKRYTNETPLKIQLIDRFIIFAFLTGVIQFLYVILVGQFPFNSFLAGFISSVGVFIFTVCLRLQVTNKDDFGITAERSYADYVVCNVILFFVVVTFIG
eukprot:TRINITY_DN7388_c0_g1_i2.p1 TRINITY_DN7388_c0_g1~~TRINITY_DN7388_c0_g1_i2.p1  ORF type:complete len:110 (-),score=7.54 TRINITY_DN7388_c0_g1_i2:86-415(-)